jgi:hypothetical protein
MLDKSKGGKRASSSIAAKSSGSGASNSTFALTEAAAPHQLTEKLLNDFRYYSEMAAAAYCGR